VPVKRLILPTLALLAPLVGQPADFRPAEPRIALVIGNSAYPSGPLRNPANDAELMHRTLAQVGFDVIARRDADQVTMKRAIQEFGARLEAGGPKAVGLFYYAGHGLQLEGRNYLIPTNARIEREGDVEIEAVSADWVIEQMRYARNALNIVILDACRNNPFVRSLRSADRGLAVMQAPKGILIAYSAAAGAVAEDGEGRNSPYTSALTRAILEVHEPVMEVFQSVREAVLAATGDRQVPGEYSEVVGHFYFTTPQGVPPPPAPAPLPARAPENRESPGAISSAMSWFASLFSSGGATASPRTPAPAVLPERMIAGARARALLDSLGIEAGQIDAAHSYPEATIRGLLESAPRRVTLGSTREQMRAALSLCRQYAADCRLEWYSDEGLRTAVLEPFELDRLAVSVDAFRQFAEGTRYVTYAERVGGGYALSANGHSLERVKGGNWRNAMLRHPADNASPVVGVTFQDAVAYCRSSGSRLPSEDEWEYVARGPDRRVFPWGDDPAPVARAINLPPRVTDGPAEGVGGRYRGLSGSVWQWVDTSHGTLRVLKGGSWLETNPANKRAATRLYQPPERADDDSGFRCARSVRVWPDADQWLSQLH
jgi:formylglycine-generating enzyme required for sulfatase activity